MIASVCSEVIDVALDRVIIEPTVRVPAVIYRRFRSAPCWSALVMAEAATSSTP